MNVSEFDYNLPKDLIAQKPVSPRDSSRLLVLNKENGQTEHRSFSNIVDYLKKGDVLVVNNSKVFPARLMAAKKESGGRVEVFLLQHLASDTWECLLKGKIKLGQELVLNKKLEATVIKNNNDGTWALRFNFAGEKLMKIFFQIGQTPLPPYIKRELGTTNKKDNVDYQTVYAAANKIGSVAAPTAGLHFTPRLLAAIEKKGVKILEVTLHVGLGTFAPIKTDNILEHKMHSEWLEIKEKTIAELLLAKKEKRRIIAVGTTSVRSLETLFSKKANLNQKSDFCRETNIFIYPGYKFKAIDALISNFHLPKSTLLLLVSALAGQDNIKQAYREAISEKYRFFSYGDAMFIY